MTRLEKIEREIEALEPQDLARFRAWFAKYDAVNWDAKIQATPHLANSTPFPTRR